MRPSQKDCTEILRHRSLYRKRPLPAPMLTVSDARQIPRTPGTIFNILHKSNGGEGGIRTRGTAKQYNGFRGRRFQPLSHLSVRKNYFVQKLYLSIEMEQQSKHETTRESIQRGIFTAEKRMYGQETDTAFCSKRCEIRSHSRPTWNYHSFVCPTFPSNNQNHRHSRWYEEGP